MCPSVPHRIQVQGAAVQADFVGRQSSCGGAGAQVQGGVGSAGNGTCHSYVASDGGGARSSQVFGKGQGTRVCSDGGVGQAYIAFHRSLAVGGYGAVGSSYRSVYVQRLVSSNGCVADGQRAAVRQSYFSTAVRRSGGDNVRGTAAAQGQALAAGNGNTVSRTQVQGSNAEAARNGCSAVFCSGAADNQIFVISIYSNAVQRSRVADGADSIGGKGIADTSSIYQVAGHDESRSRVGQAVHDALDIGQIRIAVVITQGQGTSLELDRSIRSACQRIFPCCFFCGIRISKDLVSRGGQGCGASQGNFAAARDGISKLGRG